MRLIKIILNFRKYRRLCVYKSILEKVNSTYANVFICNQLKIRGYKVSQCPEIWDRRPNKTNCRDVWFYNNYDRAIFIEQAIDILKTEIFGDK